MNSQLRVLASAALAVSAASLFLLAGCAQKETRYVVVTGDDTIHFSQGKPELNESADSFVFTDENGKRITISRDELKQIRRDVQQ